MIKICFILGTLEVGGAERQLYLLIKNLDRKRFQPVMIGLRGGRMRADFQGVAKVLVVGKRMKIDILCLIRLVRILRREKPNIIHTSMFTSNLWGRIAGRLSGVRRIVISELSMDLWKTCFHVWIDRFLACFTSAIICNSYDVKERYSRILTGHSGKIYVIFNGIDKNFYDTVEEDENIRKEFGLTGKKTIITGGRLCREKGLDYFLEAARMVSEQYNNVKFLIAGEGEERDNLMKLSHSSGLSGQVVFTGYRQNLHLLMKVSDMAVLSSLWEGMPNFLIEAMALGKPVIGTDGGGCRQIIKDGANGYIVPARDPGALAEKMLFLLRNPELCLEMGEKGRAIVSEKLDLSVLVKKHEELYLKIAGTK